MRQSLKQMEKHHQEMQKSMSQEIKSKMTDMVKMMDNRSMTNQHLDLLEKEVQAKMPDPKKVVTEVDQIVNQSEMMQMKGMEQEKK